MQFDGLLGILWFFLFLLAALVIVFLVMLIGSVVVAAVSLLPLLMLSTVHQQCVGFMEWLTDTEVDSLINWRFLVVYELVVLSYGITLLLFGAALGEFIGTIRPLVPVSDTTFLATGAVIGISVVGLLLLVVRYLTGSKWRTLAEWVAFLISVAVLTGVAAVVVPYLLFTLLQLLF